MKYPPEQVLEGRDGGRLAAVVLVAVDVQHPFAADGEHPREDALLQAGAEDDRVVLLIHVRAGREAGRWRKKRCWPRGAVVAWTPSCVPLRELARVSLPRDTVSRLFHPGSLSLSLSLPSPAACPSTSRDREKRCLARSLRDTTLHGTARRGAERKEDELFRSLRSVDVDGDGGAGGGSRPTFP